MISNFIIQLFGCKTPSDHPVKETILDYPIYVGLLTVARAGIAEEIFFRGYAIERLKVITGNLYVSVGIPLLLFSLFHYKGGIEGIVTAFILGLILTAFYLKKGDLLANIFAHFLVDLIFIIILPNGF